MSRSGYAVRAMQPVAASAKTTSDHEPARAAAPDPRVRRKQDVRSRISGTHACTPPGVHASSATCAPSPISDRRH